jgi:hypothetical protein
MHRQAGGVPNTGGRNRRIGRGDIETYWRQVETEIPGFAASAGVSGSGTATAQIGPQGVGTRWRVMQANIQTTSGAADVATCAVYVGAQVPSNLMGTSYAGGQDTIGLNGRLIQPGETVIAVWAGAHAGDTATLTVYGIQRALTNWG